VRESTTVYETRSDCDVKARVARNLAVVNKARGLS